MVKLFYFFKRRPELSAEEFHRYWREQHGPLFCNTSLARRYVVRYEQNHTAGDNDGMGGDDFDGVSVMWFQSVDDVNAMRADPEFREVVLPDGNKFINPTTTKIVLTLAEESFDIPSNAP
jgi:uncharacterized protein (TIGR02118 family)